MYTITFNEATIRDLLAHIQEGRQLYGAIVVPYSGVFTNKPFGSSVAVPKLLCPYQVDDIIAIQEPWASKIDGYVYKSDANTSGYAFRPPSTMPNSAIRMYARIVSIVTWSVTQDIIDNYLSIGVSSDGYAGTAKIVGSKDNGNRLLSEIRKLHNTKLIDKSYQPVVTANPSKYIMLVPYYYREKVQPERNGPWEGALINNKGPNSISAVAKGEDTIKGGTYIDSNEYKWSIVDIKGPRVFEYDGHKLQCVGLSPDSPDPNPDLDPVPDSKKVYRYIYVDSNDYLVPKYAYYPTEVVDPNKHMFAWLFSAYLCDKDGNIIGDWF